MDKFHPQLSNSEVLVDRENAFLLYASFCGDVVKTAAALNVDAVLLLRTIDAEHWAEKLAPILTLTKSSRPGDVERGINRALNFVISHRFRLVLMRALQVMERWTDDELRNAMQSESTSKAGKTSYRVSTRWTGDFSAALEKMAAMSYAATNDGATERVKRQDSAEVPVLDVHAAIAKAMGSVGESKTPRAMLLSAQLEVAESIKQQAAIPKKFEDDTFVDDAH